LDSHRLQAFCVALRFGTGQPPISRVSRLQLPAPVFVLAGRKKAHSEHVCRLPVSIQLAMPGTIKRIASSKIGPWPPVRFRLPSMAISSD
jgi:hypothetical protein